MAPIIPEQNPYFSMLRLNGFNIPDEQRIHMALKAYYDGCNDELNHDAVTLAGIAGTESVWQQFEPEWEKVLRKHLVKDRILHMTDLMAFQGSFSPEYGWDETQRRVLLIDLWNVMGKLHDSHLVAYSCSVLLKDWQDASAKIPHLASPESICVNFCVGGLDLPMECANEIKPVLLYFDHGEKFMRTVRRPWEKWKRQRGSLFRQIRSIEHTDSEYYPIQAADILAWVVNHAHRGIYDEFLGISSVLMIKHFSECYNYDKIIENYPSGRLKRQTTTSSGYMKPEVR